MLKRMLCLVCALFLLVPAAFADTFAYYNGDREAPRIAITMDDGYAMEYAYAALELCKQYGVTMTFFPLGDILREEDAAFWQDVIDSGCEIGSHTNHHNSFDILYPDALVANIMIFQQKLDALLGYHYQVRSLRPPFGIYRDENGKSGNIIHFINIAGFDKIVLWDVQTNDPAEALRKTQNGSILLYHARKADMDCLTELIPALIDKGFELVTVRELLGFEENTISDELFVYDKQKHFHW